MNEKLRKQLVEIIGSMECSKNFKCCEDDFANVCRAKDVGMESFLECLEEKPQKCEFAISFGYSYLCKCPLRVNIAKRLNK
ncbi:MAG: hypothetical protein ACYS32_06255 [Planctomycetota bacterium]|jgi:hypothetical protein